MASIARAVAAEVYPLKTMKWQWECPDCRQGGGYRFSDIAGTIFENTNVDLRQWFRVIHLMLTSKKGMSARQVYRYMGFGSYKTAWYMCHRIRAALQDKEFKQLMGIVEVDETFVGGHAKNRHKDKRGDGTGGTAAPARPSSSAPFSAGATSLRASSRTSKPRRLNGFVREAVSDKVSLLSPMNGSATSTSARNIRTRR